jgi:hypothetical protein
VHPDGVVHSDFCGKNENGEFVRKSAVRELARGWKDDPERIAA